jgi:parvulin-like peptidyl-prolyl isomerase
MPKKSKLVKSKGLTDNESTGKLPETEVAKRRRRKTNAIITTAVILAVIITVSVGGWYLAYQAPLRAPVIQVNNRTFSVGYLLNRCLMNTSDTNNTMSMIQNIIQEQLVEQVATQPPYNITVTEADINQELRDEMNSSSDSSTITNNSSTTTTTPTTTMPTLSDAEFNEQYRQILNRSQLSESQFREIVKGIVMTKRLNAYLIDRMPTTSDQVHLYDIVLADSTTAYDVMNRINNGEDFQTIAKEMSQDSDTNAKGGDMGWIPMKALDSSLEATASELEIGKVSYPIQTSTAAQAAQSSSNGTNDQPYYLLMVTEKASDRQIDPQYLPFLQSRLLQDWVSKQMAIQYIKLYGKGSSGGYDSQTAAYLQYEIEKLKASRGIATTTTTTTASPY